MIRGRRSKACALAALCVSAPLAAATQAGAAQTHPATKMPASISGSINWWGWTPTDSAEANAEIADFNKVYPNIKVNFKLITIANYVTAMRPALVSGEGPDLFELQPGAYVTEFNSFATNMAPVAAQALGSNWQSKIAPSGISGFTYNASSPRCRRLGVRRHPVDQRRPVQEVQLSLRPRSPSGERLQDLQKPTASAASCRATRPKASCRTPCNRSRTRSSPGYGPPRPGVRPIGTARHRQGTDDLEGPLL